MSTILCLPAIMGGSKSKKPANIASPTTAKPPGTDGKQVGQKPAELPGQDNIGTSDTIDKKGSTLQSLK